MTAEEHNKTLAMLYYIYGAMHGLTLLALLLLVFAVRMTAPKASLISTFWLAVGIVAFAVLFFAVGLLPLVVGYAFMKRTRWAKPLAIAVALISLINIPIGTALGIYTIKFLRSKGGAKLYGGKAAATSEAELQEALRGAEPLMNWARRVK